MVCRLIRVDIIGIGLIIWLIRYLPPMNRNAKEEFNQRRIQGAKFFDLDNSFSAPSPFPHTLPDPESFWKQVGALGIEKNDAIVAYDGVYSLFLS